MKATNKAGFTRKLGDIIERVGEKLISAGASRAGRKVYQFGDRLEHRNDSVLVEDRPIKTIKP